MPFNSKAIFFSVVLFYLLFFVAVHCTTQTDENQKEKLSKFGKKAVVWQQSGKKQVNKGEFSSRDVHTEYGRINLAEATAYELQPRLMISKDQDLNSPRTDEKKSDDGQIQSQARRGVNKLKRRNVSSTINSSAEVSYVRAGRQTSNQPSKNYKKLKHAETLALLSHANSGKNLSKKKSLWRRAYPTTYRTVSHNSDRLKRDVFAESSNVGPRLRANASDYYAQRKAVMERFYARQRQLSERLAQQSTSTPKNLLWSELKLNFGNENHRSTATTAAPNHLPREDPITTNLLTNHSNPEPDTTTTASFEIQQPNEKYLTDNYEPELDNYLTRTSNNVEREAPVESPTNCDNIPRTGSFTPKRKKSAGSNNCVEGERGDMPGSNNETHTTNREWGTCTGRVVYQHNLLLGVKGPSNLNTRFEVAIQGPICITCVSIVRYNNTRADVTLEGGGRGHQFITLRLKGYENEGFSYIVKVWGIRKTTNECEK